MTRLRSLVICRSLLMTEDLYTPADVKRVRDLLIKEQDRLCGITGLPTALSDYHLDHKHDEQQYVRSAAHKQANMALGKLENLAVRYLYWYPHGLPAFLRQCADYLEKPDDKRWRHPGWLRKITTLFNKLPTKAQDSVLECLLQEKGKNSEERKKLFKKALANKDFNFNQIKDLIANQQRKDFNAN